MLLLTLKLVFNFLIHFVKRSVYEVKKLVLRDNGKDLNYSQFFSEFSENACNIDHYVLQVKDTQFLLKLGFIKIKGDMKHDGRVEGLKNINIIRYNYCYKGSAICTVAEFKASELRIHYEGIIKLANIDLTFLINAVFNNVKFQIKFKIYPFQRITFYLDDVKIDELKIKTSVFGLNVISWIINLIFNYTLKIISFMILCIIEFHTKCYLNKTFSKFYFSQDYVLEKVYKEMEKYTPAQIEPCLNHLAEIEVAREILLKKTKFGPTSHFYNLLTGLFEFNKSVNKVVIKQAFDENFKDFFRNASLSESSYSDESLAISIIANSSSLISEKSKFDNSGLKQNGTNSNESSSESNTDSHSIETNPQNANYSWESHIYNSESQPENESCEDKMKESCDCESRFQDDSLDENSFHFEESCIESESQPMSEFCNKIHQSYCSEENNYQSERNCTAEILIRPENNFTHDSQPTKIVFAEDATQLENTNGDGVTPAKKNIINEDIIQPKNNINSEEKTQPENNSSFEDNTQPEKNLQKRNFL